jgi:ubiquinol-cytochrome c reductase cytochrome b subunit
VPKRMNQLGMGGSPVPGSLLTPDSPEKTAALEQARHEEAEADAAARNGHQPPEAETRTEQREAIGQQ